MLIPVHAGKNRQNISNMITINRAGLRLDLGERQQMLQHVVGEK